MNKTTSKRGNRKRQVRDRYGWKSDRSVDRAWREYKTIPPPDFYIGPFPVWTNETLDAHDAALARAAVNKSPA
jgi:hypothetical protein